MNTLKVSKVVVKFLGTFSKADQYEIACLLESIRDYPELGKPVQTANGVLYRKTYAVDKREWPTGVRVFYRRNDGIVFVLDMGDHTRCASAGAVSVYRDERVSA